MGTSTVLSLSVCTRDHPRAPTTTGGNPPIGARSKRLILGIPPKQSVGLDENQPRAERLVLTPEKSLDDICECRANNDACECSPVHCGIDTSWHPRRSFVAAPPQLRRAVAHPHTYQAGWAWDASAPLREPHRPGVPSGSDCIATQNAGSSALGAPSETVQRAAICAPGGLEWRQAVHLQDNPVRVQAAYGVRPTPKLVVGLRYRPALGKFTRSGSWGGST